MQFTLGPEFPWPQSESTTPSPGVSAGIWGLWDGEESQESEPIQGELSMKWWLAEIHFFSFDKSVIEV